MSVMNPPFHGISFRLRDHATQEFREIDLPLVQADAEVFFWVDLESVDLVPLFGLLDYLRIDRKVADHLNATEILPWIVERPNCIAFRLYEISRPETHLETSTGVRVMEATRLLVIVGNAFVLTWHPRPLDLVADVRIACHDAFRLAGKTPGFIVFLLLQQCLYDYADLNLANDNFLDRFEPSVTGEVALSFTRTIVIAGGNILLLKKLTTNLHIVLMLLATKRTPFVSEDAQASFRELKNNTMAIRGEVDSSRDLLDGVVGAIQAAAAERTSKIATVLTAVSVVMLPLGLVAGIWGMNFPSIPLAQHEYGFWWLLGGMATLALLLILAFRRLGWVGLGNR
ncbi:conserved membrane hypothetical protein [Gammaproteobacteria bacterium]